MFRWGKIYIRDSGYITSIFKKPCLSVSLHQIYLFPLGLSLSIEEIETERQRVGKERGEEGKGRERKW